jgi:hypothetical protein
LGTDRGKKNKLEKNKKRRGLKRNLKFFHHEMNFTDIKKIALETLGTTYGIL